MKTAIKSTLAVAAGAVTLASSMITPSLVSAWGDNSDDGRPSYTIEEINSGILGDKVVFNSISDGNIGDEKNFVGAQVNSDDIEYFEGNNITVEDGKEYLVRLYVHNNSLTETSHNTRVGFNLPDPNVSAKQQQINGFIFSDNAQPGSYWDYVNFNSDKYFHLEYVEDSARFGNNGFAKIPQVMTNEVVSNPEGVKIGYEGFDGEIPGCFNYDSATTIVVKAVFDTDYTIEKQVRLAGTGDWSYNVEAKVGDLVEFQIQYINTDRNKQKHENVMIGDILPKNLRIVPNTTILYNYWHQDGAYIQSDEIVGDGINIGNYPYDYNAYIRFTAEVVDDNLACGPNTLVNWADGTVYNRILRDYATVSINKVCEETPELPKTGPNTITGGVIAAGSIVTVAGYYFASRRSLRK